MNLLGKIKNVFTNDAKAGGMSLADINAFFNAQTLAQYGSDISEITYFTCLKKLSESLGKMPVNLVDRNKKLISGHESLWPLQVQPNPTQTPTQFWTTLELCRNHYGNGYAYINRRRDGALEGLYVLNPGQVTVWVNNTGEFTDRRFYYQYLDVRTGKTYWIDPENMLHVKSWMTDRTGLVGKSTREILATYLQGNKASQHFLNDLYKNGLMANVVIKYTGDLSTQTRRQIADEAKFLAGPTTDRILPVPPSWDVQPLDLKLTDAQFFEMKKFSSLQVAAAFGIMPNHLNDYEKSSYANSSMQNLTFYVDTLLYNLTLYEQELRRRLLTRSQIMQGYQYQFDVSVILRGDPVQQSQVISNLVQGTVYQINEARNAAGLPPIENGDTSLVASGYQTLDALITAPKGGDGDGKQTQVPADP